MTKYILCWFLGSVGRSVGRSSGKSVGWLAGRSFNWSVDMLIGWLVNGWSIDWLVGQHWLAAGFGNPFGCVPGLRHPLALYVTGLAVYHISSALGGGAGR